MVQFTPAMKSTLLLLATAANAAPAGSSEWQENLSLANIKSGAAKAYGAVHDALSAPTPKYFGEATRNTPYPGSACNYVRVESPVGYTSYGFQIGAPVSGRHEDNEKLCSALYTRISHPPPVGRGDVELTKWRCENDGHGNRWIGFRTDARVDEKMMAGRVKEGAFPNIHWLSREHCAQQKDELRRVKDQREGHVKRHDVPLPSQIGKNGVPPPVIGFGNATCIAEYWKDGSVMYNMNVGVPYHSGESCEKVKWAIEHPFGREFFRVMHWECSSAGYGYTWLSFGVKGENNEGIMKALEQGYAQAGFPEMKFDQEDICGVRRKQGDPALAKAAKDQVPTKRSLSWIGY